MHAMTIGAPRPAAGRRHSLSAALVGFLSSTIMLTALMVLLGQH